MVTENGRKGDFLQWCRHCEVFLGHIKHNQVQQVHNKGMKGGSKYVG